MFEITFNHYAERFSGAKRAGVVAILCFAISGCSASYRDHGYVPSQDDLAEIIVGVDTRASVEETVGAPSIAGVLEDGGLYYVQSRMRHFGLKKPEIVEREVVAISFDTSHVVANIERFSLADGKIVPLSRRVTSSSVESNGFLRQLMGNLGRFSAGDFLK